MEYNYSDSFVTNSQGIKLSILDHLSSGTLNIVQSSDR